MNRIRKFAVIFSVLLVTVYGVFGADDAAGVYLRQVKADYFADYPNPQKMSKLEKAQWQEAEKAVSNYIEFLHRTQKKSPSWYTGNNPDNKIYKPQFDKLDREYREKWQYTESLAAACGMETAILKLQTRLDRLPNAGKFPVPELIEFNHLSCYKTEATRKVMLHIICNPKIRTDFKVLFFRGLCYFENKIKYPRELLFAVTEEFVKDTKTPFGGDSVGIPFAKRVVTLNRETKKWISKSTTRIDYYTYPGTPRNQFLQFLYHDFASKVMKKLGNREETGMEPIEEEYYQKYLVERKSFARQREIDDLLFESWRWDQEGAEMLTNVFAEWNDRVEFLKKTPRGKENFFNDLGEDVPFGNVLHEYMCGYMTACGSDSKFKELMGRKYLDALNEYLSVFQCPIAGNAVAANLDDARKQMRDTVRRIFELKKLEKTNLRFREYNELLDQVNRFRPEARPVSPAPDQKGKKEKK